MLGAYYAMIIFNLYVLFSLSWEFIYIYIYKTETEKVQGIEPNFGEANIDEIWELPWICMFKNLL